MHQSDSHFKYALAATSFAAVACLGSYFLALSLGQRKVQGSDGQELEEGCRASEEEVAP